MGDRLAQGEAPEDIINSYLKIPSKPAKSAPSPPESPPKPLSKPHEIDFKIPNESEQKLAEYMKQYQVSAEIANTTVRQKDKEFKKKGKEDLVKAYEEQGKYTGNITGGEKGDSKIKHEVEKMTPITDLEFLQNPGLVFNPTDFQASLLDLTPEERQHLRYELKRDDENAAKAKKIREKIEQKREIRDKYKEFKLNLHKDDLTDQAPDAVKIHTEQNAQKVLNSILNSPKMSIKMGVLKDNFISVLRVQSNSALSLFMVFFNVINPEIERNPSEIDSKSALRESIRRKLVHSRGFIASLLVREMGLKYAPELRFVPYVVGGPAKQVVDKEVLKGIEGNSQLMWDVAEMEDGKWVTPRMPGKYTVRKVKERLEKGKKKAE